MSTTKIVIAVVSVIAVGCLAVYIKQQIGFSNEAKANDAVRAKTLLSQADADVIANKIMQLPALKKTDPSINANTLFDLQRQLGNGGYSLSSDGKAVLNKYGKAL